MSKYIILVLAAISLSACGVVPIGVEDPTATPPSAPTAEAETVAPTPDLAATVAAQVQATMAAQATAAPTVAPAATGDGAAASASAAGSAGIGVVERAPTRAAAVDAATEALPTAAATEALPTAAAAPATPATAGQPPILLILDSSGSMLADDGRGRRKIDTAKEALNALVDVLPPGAPVGLRVYGHTYPNTDKVNGCRDTELIAPVAPLDQALMKAAINSFEAKGYTPIALSLQQGAADLPPEGQRTMILVSDGEETCDPDPCLVAAQLKRTGIELVVHTVGFQVEELARNQLRCIAENTGGTYYDVTDAGQLAAQLQEITRRALQPYQTAGAQVTPGTSFNDAPLVQPGQFTFDIVPGETKYFAVAVPQGKRLTAIATLVGQPDLGMVGTIGMEFNVAGHNPVRQDVTVLQTSTSVVNAGDETVNVNFTTEPIGSSPELQPGTYYVAVTYDAFVGEMNEGLRNRLFQAELIIELT